MCNGVRCVVQAVVVEPHEGLLIIFRNGRDVVACVEWCVVLLNIARPLVRDIGPEFCCFAGAWAIIDSCTERERIVGIVLFAQGCEEMSERLFVNVWETSIIWGLNVHAVDAWWERIRPGRRS